MAKTMEQSIGDLVFVKVKSVTRPLLKLEEKKASYFKVDGQIHVAPLAEGQKPKVGPDGKEMQQPHIVHVTNLETGEESTVVANSILKTELERNYPNEGYIGKYFSVEKTGSKRSASGANYSTFQISELQVKQPETEVKPNSTPVQAASQGVAKGAAAAPAGKR